MENTISSTRELKINPKAIQIALALGGAIMIWILLNVIAMIFPQQSDAQRYIVALGGSWAGVIQTVCYGLFIYAIIELNQQKKRINYQFGAFDKRPLHFKSEHAILTPEQVAEKKLEVVQSEKEETPRYWLMELIVKVCNQYRNNNSVSETYNMLTAQVKTSKEQVESEMEPIRYIIQAISMLGFLGTVIGLTDAIAHSGDMLAIDPTTKALALNKIIGNFAMAFGTTLVALVLGLILTQSYHSYLRKMDTFFAKLESYIIDNLIIRIYHPKP